MRAPLFPSLVPPPQVCCSGFLSFTLFPSVPTPFPQELGASLACTVPGCSESARGQEWDQGIQDPGSRALGWTSGRAWGPQGPSSPPFPLLSSPPPLRVPRPRPFHTHSSSPPRWGLSTSRAGGRTAMLGLCLEPRGILLLPPPALPEPGPCAACPPAPLSPWQAEALGPPCQRPGASLNPCSASTSSLSRRQHSWVILRLLFRGACEGRSAFPVTAAPLGTVGADPGSGASPLAPSHPGS